MTQQVDGVIASGAHTSDSILTKAANIDIRFTSTGSADIEWCLDGVNWQIVETITTSRPIIFECALPTRIRLKINSNASGCRFVIEAAD